jgi:trk system potassium uptake protein TrkH
MLVGLRALAGLCCVMAIAMLMCAAIALGEGDGGAVSLFAGQAGVLVFFAASVHLAFRDRRSPLTREISFRVLIIIWLLAPFIAAPPFLLLTDLPNHLALFEATSAISTTGATAIGNLDSVPLSIIGWRAWLQWLGGLGTLISIIVVLAPSGAGGTPLLRLGGDAQQILENRVRGVFGAYIAVTLACFALLLAANITAFDAFALSLSTVSTGGMMPRPGTLTDYGAPMAEWVIGLFMLVGASSIMWHRLVATGRLGRSVTVLESISLMALAAVLGIAYAMAFGFAAGSGAVLSPTDALREGFVTAASLVSTTGFEARNAGATVLPLSLVLLMILVGGGMFSTAGGVKLYRIALMARHSLKELEHIIYPHAVHTDHLGRFAYDTDGMRAIWTAFVLFFVIWAGCGVVLAANGFAPEAALVAALSALVNAGPVYAMGWNAPGELWPAFAEINVPASLALCLTMLAGRLEVIGLVAGFSVLFFRR